MRYVNLLQFKSKNVINRGQKYIVLLVYLGYNINHNVKKISNPKGEQLWYIHMKLKKCAK